MNFILIQFIGAIGYILLAFSYFKKEKIKILFLQIISYLMFSIHFYLLSGISGTICNLLGLVTLLTIYLFEKYKWKNKNLVAMFLIAALVGINIITYQNIFSIFPMIASVIAIVSFLMNNENYIRGIGIIATSCWLVYAIAYKSYVSIIFEVATLIGVFIAFVKNLKGDVKENKKEN